MADVRAAGLICYTAHADSSTFLPLIPSDEATFSGQGWLAAGDRWGVLVS